MKKGIVIPCYNESQRLKFDDFRSFLNLHDQYILCFVNDGSKDDTVQLLRAFKSQIGSQVLILDLKQNVGKAEAVRRGVNYVLDETPVTEVGFMDADLSTDFVDYVRLSNTLQEDQLSLVFGSRKCEEVKEIERTPLRAFLSAMVGLMIQLILRLPIKDTQCGAKVFDRKTARKAFDRPFLTRWLFDVEIFIRLKAQWGRRRMMTLIREIALLSWNDVEGSKLSIKDSVQIPTMLLKISYEYSIRPVFSTAASGLLAYMAWLYN